MDDKGRSKHDRHQGLLSPVGPTAQRVLSDLRPPDAHNESDESAKTELTFIKGHLPDTVLLWGVLYPSGRLVRYLFY